MMKIDIWSDIRCPFCYVGKKNFEKALEQFSQANNIEVIWHSFKLDPNLKTQPDRNPYEFISEVKGISVEQAKAMHEHAKNAGSEAGINFNFEKSKIANSFKGHLLIQLAKTKGLANEIEEELFKAQFINAQNIADEEVLREIAKSVGLGSEDTDAAFHSEELAYAVSEDGLIARQLASTPFPFSFLMINMRFRELKSPNIC